MDMMVKSIVFVCLLVQSSILQAVSFNCEADLTKVEKIICDDPSLSNSDTELSTLYKQAYEKSRDKAELKDSQKKWLKVRNACAVKTCVSTQYMFRLSKLRRLAAIDPNRRVFEMFDTKSVKHPNMYAYEVEDIKACQLLIDNINTVDVHGVNWNCDFPLSSMVRGIKPPNWTVLTGEAKEKALGRGSNSREGVSSFSLNVDNFGDISLYNLIDIGYLCSGQESLRDRSRIWFKRNSPPASPEVDDPYMYSLHLSNRDVFQIQNEIYLIKYNGRSTNPDTGNDSFTVDKLISKGGFLTTAAACEITLKQK